MNISLAMMSQSRKIVLFVTILSIVGFIVSLYRFRPWETLNLESVMPVAQHEVISDLDGEFNAQSTVFFKSQIDVFSSNAQVIEGVGDSQTLKPTGQLPDHFKVVAILNAHVSTLVLEDTLQAKTYFLEEKKAQGEFLLLSIDRERAMLVYQGQTIEVLLKK